jgi:DNA-binding protein YbaB
MASQFPHKLEDHKASFTKKDKSKKQQQLNSRVAITGTNNINRIDLDNDILKISDKGKRVFKTHFLKTNI